MSKWTVFTKKISRKQIKIIMSICQKTDKNNYVDSKILLEEKHVLLIQIYTYFDRCRLVQREPKMGSVVNIFTKSYPYPDLRISRTELTEFVVCKKLYT